MWPQTQKGHLVTQNVVLKVWRLLCMLVYVSATSVSVCLCVCSQGVRWMLCVQGRRHDFKNEGDKTWFASEVCEKELYPPNLENWGYNFCPCGGYEQVINYQCWIHWNLLSGCHTNKFVTGLYCSSMDQWRREFHLSVVNDIYEDWNCTHGLLVARCVWIVLLCDMCIKPFGRAWYQKTDAGICFEKTQSLFTISVMFSSYVDYLERSA